MSKRWLAFCLAFSPVAAAAGLLNANTISQLWP